MKDRDKHHSRTSYAGREPELSRATPDSLRHLRALRSPFDHARDSLISTQLRDMEKAEAQRRGEAGRGSAMVRLHRPFPELRPKHDMTQIRPAFNQAWLREQRAAKLAQYQAERANSEQSPAQQAEYTHGRTQ